ncbi:phosphonate C-P lyase system protein PhnH [Bacillus horti]|uniref:Alpha-D-ribose 1-methylphosphonate 5-triphosphate synthase subunit PhnH n=1 Tax=Caldalkalibacillus horti TaxID=77523 RepID=A0ABT9W1C9_9BACI|nr:phosphonate C-P lyase system protein PhnH [Bacillus horti]MDQ0167039.1 alpha-D-ribose 1-methylphosphonate 5-triphosphate synthase subunit PhnH [Bacillus horti]
MTKAEMIDFSMVYDTQYIFRKLLDCAARPGTIHNLYNSIKMLDHQADLPPAIAGIAYTLLDREVTFCVSGAKQQLVEQSLQWKTFSKPSELEQADFVFVLETELDEQEVGVIMQQVNGGTLIDPHTSTTMVLLVQELSSSTGEAYGLRLRGPGIQESTSCSVTGLNWKWMEERAIRNQEFPLGIDMILATAEGDVMVLPRTTSVEREDQ